MGVITIQCPNTGERVSTGVETDRAGFETMPVVNSTMYCWVCGVEHVWSKRWAEFADEAAVPAGVSIKRRLGTGAGT